MEQLKNNLSTKQQAVTLAACFKAFESKPESCFYFDKLDNIIMGIASDNDVPTYTASQLIDFMYKNLDYICLPKLDARNDFYYSDKYYCELQHYTHAVSHVAIGIIRDELSALYDQNIDPLWLRLEIYDITDAESKEIEKFEQLRKDLKPETFCDQAKEFEKYLSKLVERYEVEVG